MESNMANEQDVTRLIDMLYEKVEDAKAPALKPNMSMVDRDEILDLLDELRAQLRWSSAGPRSCWPPGRSSWRTPSGMWTG